MNDRKHPPIAGLLPGNERNRQNLFTAGLGLVAILDWRRRWRWLNGLGLIVFMMLVFMFG
jgi:hypothetical protein